MLLQCPCAFDLSAFCYIHALQYYIFFSFFSYIFKAKIFLAFELKLPFSRYNFLPVAFSAFNILYSEKKKAIKQLFKAMCQIFDAQNAQFDCEPYNLKLFLHPFEKARRNGPLMFAWKQTSLTDYKWGDKQCLSAFHLRMMREACWCKAPHARECGRCQLQSDSVIPTTVNELFTIYLVEMMETASISIVQYDAEVHTQRDVCATTNWLNLL